MPALKTTRDEAMIDTVKAMAYSASTLLEVAHERVTIYMKEQATVNNPDRDPKEAAALSEVHSALCELDVLVHYVSIWGDNREHMERFHNALRDAWNVIHNR